MGKGIKEEARAQEREPVSLSELIHQHVRVAIETAVHEELRAALGSSPYERSLEAWRTRSLADLDVIYVYLDGFALRVSTAGKVVSVPVLGVVGVLSDGHKHLLALDLCGGESFPAWKGCLDDLVARGLRPPVLAIIDGNAGLRRAVGLVWPRAAVQRCCVHKLRNLERKAPKYVLAEIHDDFHRIVYAATADAACLDGLRAHVGQALPRRRDESS